MADNIAHANMLFYPLYYDMISLISEKIIQALTCFAENQGDFWNFKIHNSVWITKGSGNGDSDNQGCTVYIYSRTSIIQTPVPLQC